MLLFIICLFLQSSVLTAPATLHTRSAWTGHPEHVVIPSASELKKVAPSPEKKVPNQKTTPTKTVKRPTPAQPQHSITQPDPGEMEDFLRFISAFADLDDDELDSFEPTNNF